MLNNVGAACGLIGELIRNAARRLADCGIDTPVLDAEVMAAAAAGITRLDLIGASARLAVEQVRRFEEMVSRRERREPIAYIIGRREFYSLDFFVTPAVLIPRPETEAVVDKALCVAAGRQPGSMLEIGTGSGCIALAIAANTSGFPIVATDVSDAALHVAGLNARRLGLRDRVELRPSDLFDNLADQRFDVIVSNPPYVEESALLPPEVAKYEPPVALFAGPDGLAIYRRLAASAREHLNPGGTIIVEVGAGQAYSVASLFDLAGAVKTEIMNDLAGISRVVAARFR